MAAKYYNYAALAVGASFTNTDTTKATAIGATSTSISNGTLVISSDAPTGLANSIEGTTQSVSGSTYIFETISSTTVMSGSIYWKMPFATGNGGGLYFAGTGGTRQFAAIITSAEQVQWLNAAGSNMFTTTFSGGFVAGQWYRTDFHATQGTTTTGVFQTATYTEHSVSALTGTTFSSSAMNLGTTGITQLRHGPRVGTTTADENLRYRTGYDPASAYLMGPQPFISGTLSASVPRVTATIAGTQTDPGTLAASLPTLTGTLTGTSTNPGTLTASLPLVTGAVTGTSVNPGTLTASTPLTTASVAGQSINLGTLAGTLPLPTSAIDGNSVNPGTLLASTILIAATLTGELVAVATPRPPGPLTATLTVPSRLATLTAPTRSATITTPTRTATVEAP